MKIYLRSMNKTIEVSKEAHDDYYRDINAYRCTQQNHERCTCPKTDYCYCDMDCHTCKNSFAGDKISLDCSLTNDKNDGETMLGKMVDEVSDTEKILADKLLLETHIKRMKELTSGIFRVIANITQTGVLNHVRKYPTSIEGARAIINIFKDWVENNRGWAIIQDTPTQKLEKAVQRFMHLSAKFFVEINNLDFSCEADEGRGSVDIKISRGTDKSVVEIKLSSNCQYLHGYKTQLAEYGQAERTRNLIYVFVDMGNPGRRQKLLSLYDEYLQSCKPCPELIIIDV